MRDWIRHIAGEYVDGVQYCVVCGKILTDHRNVMVPVGQPLPGGWEEGDVFIKGGITMKGSPDNFVDLPIRVNPGTREQLV